MSTMVSKNPLSALSANSRRTGLVSGMGLLRYLKHREPKRCLPLRTLETADTDADPGQAVARKGITPSNTNSLAGTARPTQ
jgi:hypothetical protein